MNRVVYERRADNVVHFVTGATGLFGSEYVSTVLSSSKHTRCALLIKARDLNHAHTRANELVHYLFGGGSQYHEMRKRIDVYLGDVCYERFGLNKKNFIELAYKTDYIFHAASNSNLNDDEELMSDINIAGTTEVLRFAARCTRLTRMLHVSSAYVSGTQTGVISSEDAEFDSPTSDNFQASKRIAEILVREKMPELPIVILRPTTLVGHSRLGRTNSFKAFYYPIKQLVAGKKIYFPLTKSGKIEAIPADWAASIALKLTRAKGVVGRTFHLSMGDRAYTVDQVGRIIFKYLDKHGAVYKPAVMLPSWLFRLLNIPLISLFLPMSRDLRKELKSAAKYTYIDRIYDNTDTFRATGEDKNMLPGLEGYFDKLYAYAIDNKWKKQKAPGWVQRHNLTRHQKLKPAELA